MSCICSAKVWNLCIGCRNLYKGKIWIKDVSYTCKQRLLVRKEQKHQGNCETCLLGKKIVGFVPLNWGELHFQYIRIIKTGNAFHI